MAKRKDRQRPGQDTLKGTQCGRCLHYTLVAFNELGKLDNCLVYGKTPRTYLLNEENCPDIKED